MQQTQIWRLQGKQFMPAVYLCTYIYIYMAYDIVSRYLNIRNKANFAVTEHLCWGRIHWPSKLWMYKYFHLASSWRVCVTNVNTRPAFYGRSRFVFCQDVTVLESWTHEAPQLYEKSEFASGNSHDCIVCNGSNLCQLCVYVYIYIHIYIWRMILGVCRWTYAINQTLLPPSTCAWTEPICRRNC